MIHEVRRSLVRIQSLVSKLVESRVIVLFVVMIESSLSLVVFVGETGRLYWHILLLLVKSHALVELLLEGLFEDGALADERVVAEHIE